MVGHMTGRQPSKEVAAYLDALYEQYDGFDVTQTTVSVDPEEFDEVATAGDTARVRAHIEGAKGLLAVPDDEGWTVPSAVVEEPSREAADRIVRDQTGVEPNIETLRSVSLVCLQCEELDEEIWELSAVFEGEVEAGTPTEEAAWRDGLSEESVAF
jgi:ADP-ribose pyrophosphatase YjhB (NUDIX family)